ncbi:MAG: hypothetical protein DRN07_06605 [Thermoplasmata archaeon]|nr:MAG: hypothetical protein DRN07_06605 [Thermoplasmata archaeon]
MRNGDSMTRPLSAFPLKKDEHVVWVGKRCMKSLWPWLFIGFVTLPLYGIGTPFILYAIIAWLRVTYVITNLRVAEVIEHYAFVRHEVREISQDEIRSMYTTQSSMGRMLGYWNVIIENSRRLILRGVPDPEEVKMLVKQAGSSAHREE